MSRRLTDLERMYRATPESAVVRAVIDYLSARGGLAWRVNTGGNWFSNPGSDTSRFVRFSETGTSDVFCIMNGRFIAVECKRETGKRSEQQIAWQARVVEHGGIAVVCRASNWQQVLDAAVALGRTEGDV